MTGRFPIHVNQWNPDKIEGQGNRVEATAPEGALSNEWEAGGPDLRMTFLPEKLREAGCAPRQPRSAPPRPRALPPLRRAPPSAAAFLLPASADHTVHIGKWHLGMRQHANLPIHRGFDRSLAMLMGSGDHWQHVRPSPGSMSSDPHHTPATCPLPSAPVVCVQV